VTVNSSRQASRSGAIAATSIFPSRSTTTFALVPRARACRNPTLGMKTSSLAAATASARSGEECGKGELAEDQERAQDHEDEDPEPSAPRRRVRHHRHRRAAFLNRLHFLLRLPSVLTTLTRPDESGSSRKD